MSKIKVLIINDSAFMRQFLKDLLSSSDQIEVIGTANNGLTGLELIKKHRPDVITMDIDMPVLDGISTLKILKKECPTPVILFSTSLPKDSNLSIEALEYGAFDFILKDKKELNNTESLKTELINKILLAYKSQNIIFSKNESKNKKHTKSILSLVEPKAEIVIIGTSTGGPQALLHIIPQLPYDFSVPIVIIQHMPLYFTASLAKRLNELSQLNIKEAQDGDKLEKGNVYIAKGDYHLLIDNLKRIRLSDEEPYYGVRPSLSKTIFSAIKVYGGKILVVVLTGMGHDGADSVRVLKKLGGKCIVQDESSCTVFGMPKAIIDDNNADKIVPLKNIPSEIVNTLAYWI